jgi:hypothetical protein
MAAWDAPVTVNRLEPFAEPRPVRGVPCSGRGRLVSPAAAVAFVWLALLLAVSFPETPLKFRAPGVTLQVGPGIGRLVCRALDTVSAGHSILSG